MMILSKNRNVFLLFFAGAAALAAAESGAPSPERSLADAELGFARAAHDHGIRESFLQFLAEDAVVFGPGPTNGKKVYLAYEEKGHRLSWQPIFVTVARAGDLGFTTGPWEFRKSAAEPEPIAFGQFVSVWKKQPDHSWKVLVDLGIDHPKPTASPGEVQLSPPSGPWLTIEATMRGRALSKAEKSLSDGLQVDAGVAVLDAADDDLRLLRDGAFPAAGITAAQSMLRTDHRKLTRTTSGGGMSASGDLAYDYGSYSAADDARDKGYYVSLWKIDREGHWKLLLDLQKKAEEK